jgi:hypothetical protein
MDKQDNDTSAKGIERSHTVTAASASGASLTGRSLLPMLLASLFLIVVGMLVVVFFV